MGYLFYFASNGCYFFLYIYAPQTLENIIMWVSLLNVTRLYVWATFAMVLLKDVTQRFAGALYTLINATRGIIA